MKTTKKLLAALLAVVMVFGIIPVMSFTTCADTNFSGYTAIYNESGLNAIKNNPSGKYYLANNINLSNNRRTAICDLNTPFTGIFDGNGYGITGLNFSATIGENYALYGLFGVNKGTIKNLKIQNCNVSNELTDVNKQAELYYGVISAVNFGTIENCHVLNSKFEFTVICDNGGSSKHNIFIEFGGISGINYNTIKNCSNYNSPISTVANVNANYCNAYARAAGIVSTNAVTTGYTGKVIDCYNTAAIQSSGNGYRFASGIVAYNTGTVENCFNNGNIKTIVPTAVNMEGYTAGVVANNLNGTVTKCRNRGTITGSDFTAGVVAINGTSTTKNSKTDKCYNDGKVNSTNSKGQAKSGGIAAQNFGTVTNCFNNKAITTKSSNDNAYSGGIVASNFAGSIKYCYNVGALSATAGKTKKAYIGAIAAAIDEGTVTCCYYPSNQKGAGNKTVGKGLSESALKKKASYSGFNFTNTWFIDSSNDYPYPVLRLSCDDVHIGKYTTSAKATLTKNGTRKYVCSLCGKTTETTTINKIGTVKLSGTAYTYTGSVKKPTVTVKDSAGKTISSSNYTVTYASGRKYVGKYKVTVKFKGNYSGTKTLYFTINPAKTTVSSLTAGSKKLTVKITKKSSQVSGYQIQYSTSKKFSSYKTKTVSYKTTKTTLSSLKAKTTYYVRVRTYKTVGGTRYYSGWSSYKYKKTK